MNTPIFFDLSSKFLGSTFHASPIGINLDEINSLDSDANLIKGKLESFSFPIVFKQSSGKNMTDILDTGFPGLFLISNELKLLLEENHFTGWKAYPIKLYDKKNNEITGYHGFSITGHCGPQSYERSEVIEKRFVSEGPICKYYKGLFIDDWDGSDFFTPKYMCAIMVTEKVAKTLKKHKITNLRLQNLNDYEIGLSTVKMHKELEQQKDNAAKGILL